MCRSAMMVRLVAGAPCRAIADAKQIHGCVYGSELVAAGVHPATVKREHIENGKPKHFTGGDLLRGTRNA
jgi:hypothetical protein